MTITKDFKEELKNQIMEQVRSGQRDNFSFKIDSWSANVTTAGLLRLLTYFKLTADEKFMYTVVKDLEEKLTKDRRDINYIFKQYRFLSAPVVNQMLTYKNGCFQVRGRYKGKTEKQESKDTYCVGPFVDIQDAEQCVELMPNLFRKHDILVSDLDLLEFYVVKKRSTDEGALNKKYFEDGLHL